MKTEEHPRKDTTSKMKKIIRAISIRQPFVELILIGKKRKEYRSRPTRIQNERVYLYAALKTVKDRDLWKRAGKDIDQLPLGRIVGSVEIVGCEQNSDGGYAYLLANPKRIRQHLFPKNSAQPCFWRPQF